MVKKTFLFLTAIFMAAALIACTAKKEAPDWAGEYFGITPAADAEGINVNLILNADLTYSITYEFIDRDGAFTDTGSFSLNETGDTIIITDTKVPSYYKIGKGFVQQLDLAGNEIEGEFADMYVLNKK
ncbi:MAG: copper resistance protein NlpE [Treponema sp.]|nr:copper resistance protein NlpE [Treponema sp.]